jgi:hypothetical protein
MDDLTWKHALRDYTFPPRPTGECNEWCAPLHMIERAVAGADFARHFDVCDFMVMAAFRRRGKPLLYLYKHAITRRYLNVDAAGQVWQYIAPKHDRPDDRGRYVKLRDIRTAVAALDLEMVANLDDWADDEPSGSWQ